MKVVAVGLCLMEDSAGSTSMDEDSAGDEKYRWVDEHREEKVEETEPDQMADEDGPCETHAP